MEIPNLSKKKQEFPVLPAFVKSQVHAAAVLGSDLVEFDGTLMDSCQWCLIPRWICELTQQKLGTPQKECIAWKRLQVAAELFFFFLQHHVFFILLLEPQLGVLKSEVQIDDVRAFFQRMDKDSPTDQVRWKINWKLPKIWVP